MILLFNCNGCTFRIADGSDAASVMGETEDLTVIAMFNMQVRSTALPLLCYPLDDTRLHWMTPDCT